MWVKRDKDGNITDLYRHAPENPEGWEKVSATDPDVLAFLGEDD